MIGSHASHGIVSTVFRPSIMLYRYRYLHASTTLLTVASVRPVDERTSETPSPSSKSDHAGQTQDLPDHASNNPPPPFLPPRKASQFHSLPRLNPTPPYLPPRRPSLDILRRRRSSDLDPPSSSARVSAEYEEIFAQAQLERGRVLVIPPPPTIPPVMEHSPLRLNFTRSRQGS